MNSRNEQDRSHILAAAEKLSRERLGGDTSGHDWWHVDRVRRMALRLAREEQADPFVVELAALLHDVADAKLVDDPAAARDELGRLLRDWGAGDKDAEHVLEIIATLSFGSGNRPPMRTPEGSIVQDADRLDAIGAIGVARVFAYSGWSGRPLHVPAEDGAGHEAVPAGVPSGGETAGAPTAGEGAASYPDGEAGTPAGDGGRREAASSGGPLASEEVRGRILAASGELDGAIAHFAAKLLLLKDRMNTAAARRIAGDRHRFLEEYANRFLDEWEGRS
ncbi:HD domain-containing protein [Paenibacillus sp. J31TS4]|uniref:HD domain-containing protein n=1 Tax=Paenibacillus sp. J31TS4 TaxID=2807195 RepID=UPI001BCEF398|nr:HD domain-containing protein [Paenibacillus sp. J31TS4]